MIDPNAVSTIRVGELSPEPFSLTDKIPHEVGTELKRGTIEDLATFISAFIGSTDGVGFRAISVTDGQTLPTTTQQEFILVGKGTYYNVVGGSTIICTEELNAIVSNGSYWFIGVEIPVNVELAGITQFIRDGFISTTPSEDAVYDALALKANVADSEDVTNKVSTISTYSTTLYPNEKATHDALDLKLNISDLPTNLTLYPTNVASDVSGYVKMVTDIHAPDYNTVAVDVSTPTITGTGQLVSQRITDAGVLIGQPGVFNFTTFGNIRRLSGSGTAEFYTQAYHRDSLGVETLVGTSSPSAVVVNGTYAEFTTSGVWDDGEFAPTDRIVIKSYANRIAGGSDPIYQFQFGGTTPVRTLLPVPFSVVDAGYELKANKQNDLTIDGTGTKYPTVDAVNSNVIKTTGEQTKTGMLRLGNGAFTADDSALLINRSILTGGTALGFHAIRDETLYDTNDVTGLRGYASFDAIPKMQGTTTFNHIHSFQSRPNYSGTGLILAVRGFTHLATITGSVDLHQAIFIDDYLGTGTVNQNVGVYIKPLLKGVSNYAIFSEGSAPSFFGGTLQTNGLVQASTAKFTSYSGTFGSFPTFDSTGAVMNNSTLTYINGVLSLKHSTAKITSTSAPLELNSLSNLLLSTSGTERARMTTAGNLLVGSTTDNGALDKLQVTGTLATTSTIKAGATVRLKNYTVATLPAGVQGDTAYVTDATAPTYLGTLTGGGAVVCPVFYNGTAWVSH